MSKNILRKAARLNIVMKPPKFHPFNPLLALRASSYDMDPLVKIRLIDGLFKGVWADHKHISEEEVVAEISNRVGADSEELIRFAKSKRASTMLCNQTEMAVDKGVFGIPTMIIDDELFFGYDDFEFIELYLEGEDPLARSSYQSWNKEPLTASSVRKEMKLHGSNE
jgi:2-hydroxychromene-2-carboxylate isomerase